MVERLNDCIKFHANQGLESKSLMERLIAVINDCIQTSLSFSCSFVGLAALCTCSSILTRIVLATAIDTRDVTITWLYTMTLKVGITMILKLYETNRDTRGSALMFYRKPCLFFESFQLKYKMHLFVVFNFTCCQAILIHVGIPIWHIRGYKIQQSKQELGSIKTRLS